MADNLQNKLLSFLLGGGDTEHVTAAKNELLKAILAAESTVPPQSIDYPTQATLLKNATESLGKTHKFQMGQLVKWKRHLQNKTVPQFNQPAVVLEIVEPFVDPVQDSNSIYYREKLDMRVGVILVTTGDMLPYYVSSNRFEPY